jgi:hypothetical protein
VEREDDDDDPDRPTVTIRRDALAGLIHKTSTTRAHTVSRDQLQSRGTNDDLARARLAPLERPVEPKADEAAFPPLLVLAVITVLLVAFIASTQLR